MEPIAHFNAGTFQGQPVPGDVNANIETIEAISTEAALRKQADIVLFPELFMTGYNAGVQRLRDLSVTVDSEEIRRVQRIAKRLNIAIAFGYPERSIDSGSAGVEIVYNSCILIDSRGEVALNYRKTHLWDPDLTYEKEVFTPGDSLPVCDLFVSRLSRSFRVGILICFDCEFPEPCRVLAVQGAEIVLIPTGLGEGEVADKTPTACLSTRAQENHVFIVYSNLVGPCQVDGGDPDAPITDSKFCGQSGVLAPDGTDLVRANKTESGLFCASLNKMEYEVSVCRNDFMALRRPELYLTALQSVNYSSSCGDNMIGGDQVSSAVGYRRRLSSRHGGFCDGASLGGAYNNQPIIMFNAAGDSPMPAQVLAKVKRVLDVETEIGGYAAAEEEFAADFASIYMHIGRLIRAQRPELEIALVDSATTAWTRAFYSITLHPGDVVLTTSVEYASNYLAILQQTKRFGAEVQVIPSASDGTVSVAALKDILEDDAVGPRVRVVSITWIPTNGGVVNDAKSVGLAIRNCAFHDKIVFILDACQAVGQIPVNVEEIGCDVLTATGRKYLRGPRGTGFLYVKQTSLQRHFKDPVTLDLLSARWLDASTYEVIPSARRFEQWEKNVAGLIGLGGAVQHLLDTVGETLAYTRLANLASELRSRLRAIEGVQVWDMGTLVTTSTSSSLLSSSVVGTQMGQVGDDEGVEGKESNCSITGGTSSSQCGIVTFSCLNKDMLFSAHSIKAGLRLNNIFVSVTTPSSTLLDATARDLPDMVRASLHYYNTSHEIDVFCSRVREILSQ